MNSIVFKIADMLKLIYKETVSVLKIDSYYKSAAPNPGSNYTIGMAFRSVLIGSLVSIVVISGIIVAMDFAGTPFPDNRNNFDWKSSISYFNIAIIGPIYEELKFRLILIYSPLNFSLTAAIWLLYALSFFNILDSQIASSFYPYSACVFFVSVALYSFLSRFEYLNVKLKTFFFRYQYPVLYLSAIVFCLMHSVNYDFKYFAQVFVLVPQLFGGFILSYYRIRDGIYVAMFLHIVNNSIPYLLHYI